MPKKYNDIGTEAARLGLSRRSLERYCKNEGFPYIRIVGRLLFDPDVSDQHLATFVRNGRAHELSLLPTKAA